MIPDLSNTEKMAHIGRMAVLKSERRKLAQQLRDSLLPILNHLENSDRDVWKIDGIIELVNSINEISNEIDRLTTEKPA